MGIQLITLQEARDQVRVTNDDSNYDLETKIEEASAIFMRHAKLAAVPEEWFIGTPPVAVAPLHVKTAVKLILGELYLNREGGISNPLSDNVKGLIDRDPTMA
jgi:hypothetical protein